MPYKHWKAVQELRISFLCLVLQEKLLATSSFDCSCRIICSETGSPFFHIPNPGKVMYTGITFHEKRGVFVLTDEVGFIEMFSILSEKTVVRHRVLSPRDQRHMQEIKQSHKDALLSHVTLMDDENLLTLLPVPNLSRAAANAVEVLPVGEVAVWKILEDITCKEFLAHENPVLSIFLHPSSSTPSQRLQGGNSILKGIESASFESSSLVSTFEQRIFSVDTQSFRCWDLRDCQQSFERPLLIKTGAGAGAMNQRRAEVTFAHCVWSLNSTAIGYEDGTVTLWKNDAGTRVVCRRLKDSITCIVEARKLQAHVLAVSDFAGTISVFNLTLLSAHPGELPHDISFTGPHSSDDPSILSMTYHAPTRTLFSGGSDMTIKASKLDSEATTHCGNINDAVCCLQCSESFLVAGDEQGGLAVFRIMKNSETQFHSHISSMFPDLTLICKFDLMGSSASPSKTVCALWETNPHRVAIVQGGADESTLWAVKMRKVSTEKEEVKEEKKYKEVSREEGKCEKGHEETKSNGDNSQQAIIEEGGEGWEILSQSDNQRIVTVLRRQTFSHSSLVANSIAIGGDGHDGSKVGCVFIGTMEGPLLRYSVHHY
jgi:hypothetical protein